MSVDLPDGTRLWTTTSGTGPPVVLLHGGPGLWDYLGPLAELLEDHHTVVRLDQRGCGRSTGDQGPFTIAQAVGDLRDVQEALGYDSWSVLGHSWGAELALWYAASDPDRVGNVCYVSGVGVGEGFREGHDREFRRRLGDRYARWEELRGLSRAPEDERELCLLQWEPDFAPGPDARRHAEEFWELRPRDASVNLRANRELWADRATDDLLARVAGLHHPVTMLFGAEDPRPWTAAESLRESLPHLRDHVVLDGAGHAPWVERPDEVREVLLAAL